VRAGVAAAAGLAALAGLGLGLALRGGDGASPEALVALAARLDEEREARGRHAAQLARLEADLAALREGGTVGEGDVAPYPVPPGEAGEAAAAASGDEVPPEVEPSPGQAWFDPRRLAAAGLPERDVDELHRLYEDVELQRLYLQNQAQRERWPRDRLATELAALDERLLSVREDYGEDAYDWFLYAAGRANRVVVEGVLGGSAAAEAGLRTGDAIVRYDGERIFKPPTLIRGTLAGRLNETVEVEIERQDGTRTTVTLPRGPVGVRLGRRTVEPSAPR
jgi:membrane-associated protease RseP (regulator of RpoE activity)